MGRLYRSVYSRFVKKRERKQANNHLKIYRIIISLFQKGEVFMPGKARLIPANTNDPMKHVVIYARVSSNTMDQLESLKAQISGFIKFVSGHNNWKLVDIHIDIASAGV